MPSDAIWRQDLDLRWFMQWFVKGIKNGCPCIVKIRGIQGYALVGELARAVGEYSDVTKAQPCMPLISTIFKQPFLILSITWNVK